jgi:hypothetical protein
VRLIGLRTRARSEERAQRQWSTLLRGAAAREAGALVYRWPRSPLRIAVEIDPTLEEGPLHVEIASDRRLPALDTPELGAVFVLEGASR